MFGRRRRSILLEKCKICKTTCDAYIVPFSENLKNLLKNDDIRFNIENSKLRKPGVYQTVLDGS